MKKNKVVLGLSGGVDSTAAALILKEKGYEVTGLYFDVFGGSAKSEEGRAKAETAAEQLGIKFIYRDLSDEFREKVIGNFCSEYSCGRTPNPCIVCNPGVKFRVLLETADREGAQYIATGHYAGTYHDEATDTWFIRRAANEAKDQSYMLYRLGQEVVSRLLLPLNDVDDKEKIRDIARKNDMKNAEAKDSQEICFIEADDNYKDFLKRRGYETPEGDFVDAQGNVLGRHKGILNYTIGQRKGLGIALGKPAFVTAIDGVKDQVVLGDNADLFKTEVCSSGNVMFGVRTDVAPMEGSLEKGSPDVTKAETSGGVCTAEDGGSVAGNGGVQVCQTIPDELKAWLADGIRAKIRYAAKPAEASVTLLDDGRIMASFSEPQRAPTPGQSIVFYKGDLVIGGGFID
ncbi:MAG: tRNA 2-thiouridine(34) synthase MnmA [Eubacteriaceae bacterium]|nr:tRNA 2-thiouridine(34) synthase MnmA [Eubacteriaceae bacterium]